MRSHVEARPSGQSIGSSCGAGDQSSDSVPINHRMICTPPIPSSDPTRMSA
jgi:hypothetical protein